MKVEKGQYIYRQGEISDSLYFINSGEIGLFSTKLQNSTLLTSLGPGQIVGDLGYFTGGVRTSDAIAMVPTDCTRVTYEMVRLQFEAIPPWIRAMTRTMATQVQSYSKEIKPLRDHEDGAVLSRLVLARAWAALTLVPQQYGERRGDHLYIDWPALRTLSNLCFREISQRVLQLADALQAQDLCRVTVESGGPSQITILAPDTMAKFLSFYTRAITNNSPELTRLKPVEIATLTTLSNPELKAVPIHRGQVEIDLADFIALANRTGHPEVSATSVDLLQVYGLELNKASTDAGVKIRFHQQEVTSRAKFWSILQTLHDMDPAAKCRTAA